MEMRVSAAHCLTTGGSAESKHRLWLFTPTHRRPRTAFGISLRAEALHPLFRKPKKEDQLEQETQSNKICSSDILCD